GSAAQHAGVLIQG
ncbi:hypothetical protein A2U01_0111873, partial [Trifolium medium]|nr:hypothetical protein [Trifolium medium]